MSAPTSAPHFRIAILGSGFGGLCAAIRLKQEGVSDFVVFERSPSLGGVWRDNTYPGCGCDVESLLYSFSFAPNADWSQSFSAQPEILAYLARCAEHFKITSHIRFSHDVERARWNEARGHWEINTSRGNFSADILVAAPGGLSEPAFAEIPGRAKFSGTQFHSARWNHDYDLRGKTVAVIGTGASAIQFVPQIQPLVKKLYLFQRSAPWVLPRSNRRFTSMERALFRALPATQKLLRAGIYWWHESFVLGFRHPKLMRGLQRVAKWHMHRSIQDPLLRRKLLPSYTIGCKRILPSNNYYPALAQSNVEVVTDKIVELQTDSILTADGIARRADAIIFGTGFQVTDGPLSQRIVGRDDKTLGQVWQGSPKAHLGTTVAGFPNLFLITGPNTGLGHSSMVYIMETQVEHLLNALRYMERRQVYAIEPTPAAQQNFVNKVERGLAGTVWASGCSSWYIDRTGRNSTLWPTFTFLYRRRVEPFVPAEYHLRHDYRASATASRSLEHRAARFLFSLPPNVLQRALGKPKRGRPQPRPDVALLVKLRQYKGVPEFHQMSPQEGRRLIRRETLRHAGTPLQMQSVRDLLVHQRAARHYVPHAPGPHPLLVYFHGGGFVVGDLYTHDVVCRMLAHHAGIQVLSIDYRLAPEHPFPCALDDAESAFKWATRHARELGAEETTLLVGGDSAGGNIAAVLCQRLRNQNERTPALQLLIYPATDRTVPYPSLADFGEGYFLTQRDMDWFTKHYAQQIGVDLAQPEISPLLGRLENLPPAFIVTAELDPLRDEGEAYGKALERAGNTVTLRRMNGLIHGFVNMTTVSPSCRDAVIEMSKTLRALITKLPSRPMHRTASSPQSGVFQ